MTKEDIRIVAKEYASRFMEEGNYLLSKISYTDGAEMVNEKQPYSAEDMQSLMDWLEIRGIIGLETGKKYIKLWNESKNG